jgi:hypothetical protein
MIRKIIRKTGWILFWVCVGIVGLALFMLIALIVLYLFFAIA